MPHIPDLLPAAEPYIRDGLKLSWRRPTDSSLADAYQYFRSDEFIGDWKVIKPALEKAAAVIQAAPTNGCNVKLLTVNCRYVYVLLQQLDSYGRIFVGSEEAADWSDRLHEFLRSASLPPWARQSDPPAALAAADREGIGLAMADARAKIKLCYRFVEVFEKHRAGFKGRWPRQKVAGAIEAALLNLDEHHYRQESLPDFGSSDDWTLARLKADRASLPFGFMRATDAAAYLSDDALAALAQAVRAFSKDPETGDELEDRIVDLEALARLMTLMKAAGSLEAAIYDRDCPGELIQVRDWLSEYDV